MYLCQSQMLLYQRFLCFPEATLNHGKPSPIEVRRTTIGGRPPMKGRPPIGLFPDQVTQKMFPFDPHMLISGWTQNYWKWKYIWLIIISKRNFHATCLACGQFCGFWWSSTVKTLLLIVPHICVNESGQHWFRYWLIAYYSPSHYLIQLSEQTLVKF